MVDKLYLKLNCLQAMVKYINRLEIEHDKTKQVPGKQKKGRCQPSVVDGFKIKMWCAVYLLIKKRYENKTFYAVYWYHRTV